MNRTAVALAFLTLAACDVPPEGASRPAGDPVEAISKPLTITTLTAQIDFDTAGGLPVASGSAVDTLYSSVGVTFSGVSAPTASAYAVNHGTSNGVSVFSNWSFFDRRWGAVRADFAMEQGWVSLDVRPVLPPEYLGTVSARPWLEAYDASGNLLAQVYYPIAHGQPNYGSWQTLRIDRTINDIKYVRFSSQHIDNTPAVYGLFDNLGLGRTYTFGDPIVWEPRPPRLRLYP